MTDVSVLDLDPHGKLLHPETGRPLALAEVPAALNAFLDLDTHVTDVFVHVHGWRTSQDSAEDAATRLFGMVTGLQAQQPGRYPAIGGRFVPHYVCVRWPSGSLPTAGGYRAVRDRAADMAERGHATEVLGVLLGYLNAWRRIPKRGPRALGTAGGQYLHLVGHSFGGRFLAHAVLEAQRYREGGPPTLRWPWQASGYPWTVDSLTVFQMAVPADAFGRPPYDALLGETVLNGPVVLTHTPEDRALGLWHRQAEGGSDGVGLHGATAPKEQIAATPLLPVTQRYVFEDPPRRILNVDARATFRGGSLVSGAHSDYFHPESAHLLLSLADASR